MLFPGWAVPYPRPPRAGEQGEDQEAHFMSPHLRHTEPRNYAGFGLPRAGFDLSSWGAAPKKCLRPAARREAVHQPAVSQLLRRLLHPLRRPSAGGCGLPGLVLLQRIAQSLQASGEESCQVRTDVLF